MFKNSLLRSLDSDSLNLLRPHLSAVDLPVEFELENPRDVPQWAYFIEKGIAGSVVSGREVEVGLIGPEGMTGLSIALHTDRPVSRVDMQIAGEGFRIPRDRFRELLENCRSLQDLVLRYAHTLLAQTSSTVASNAKDVIPVRLARWLLMVADRIGDDGMRVSHDYLSKLLGVRRAGVTDALHVLEGEHLIKAERLNISIRDRSQLEARAGKAYGLAEAEYARLILGADARAHKPLNVGREPDRDNGPTLGLPTLNDGDPTIRNDSTTHSTGHPKPSA